MPLPLPPLALAANDQAMLAELAQAGSRLSGKLRLRVLILEELVAGATIKETAAKLGTSREWVRRVRAVAERSGIRALVEESRLAGSGAGAVQNGQRGGRRGRRRIGTLKEFSNSRRSGSEPVIEIVKLVLAGDLQLAVIGLYKPVLTKSAGRKSSAMGGDKLAAYLQRKILEAVEGVDEPASWTEFPLDQDFKLLELELQNRLDQVRRESSVYGTGEPGVRKFASRWHFYVLVAGAGDAVARTLAFWGPCRRGEVHRWPEASFLPRLASLLSHLRLQLDIVGLCPCVRQLLHEAGRDIEDAQPFVWSIDQNVVHESLRRRLTAQAVLAHSGYLAALTAGLSQAIRVHDRIAVDIPKLHARAEQPENAPEIALAYFVLPELAYPAPLRADELATARSDVARRRPRQRFEYAVRRRPGQPTTSAPKVEDGKLRQRGVVALITLPRHYLLPAPQIKLAALVKLAERGQQRFEVGVAGRKQFLFTCPELLDAIRESFRRNTYADELESLQRWKGWLAHQSDNEIPRADWYWDLLHELPELSPPFFFSEADLRNPKPDVRLAERLNAAHIPYISPGGTSLALEDRYRADAVFHRLLANVDADYLLRFVDNTAWERASLEADRFSAQGAEWLAAEYFRAGAEKSQIDLLIATVPTSLRFPEFIQPVTDEILGWGQEALGSFRPFPRVLRHAVETAQRLALAGLPPMTIALCEADVLERRWKAHLGHFFASKLIASAERRGTEILSAEIEAAAAAGEDDEL